MDTTLGDIFRHPNLYKMCRICGHPNIYHESRCVSCGSKEFLDDGDQVIDWAERELEYWTKERGLLYDTAIKKVYEV